MCHPKMVKYSNDHSSDTGAPQKSSISLHVVMHLCQLMAQNSEIWGGSKKCDNFLTAQKS